jgi:hypothetical protein
VPDALHAAARDDRVEVGRGGLGAGQSRASLDVADRSRSRVVGDDAPDLDETLALIRYTLERIRG